MIPAPNLIFRYYLDFMPIIAPFFVDMMVPSSVGVHRTYCPKADGPSYWPFSVEEWLFFDRHIASHVTIV